MYVYKSMAESSVTNAAFRVILLAAQSRSVFAEKGKPLFRPVSRCARFFEQSRVCTPFLPMKANVGRLCEKLKNAMKNGLGRSCSGNFLAIFVGTVLGEKPNFTGRFSE